MTKDPLNISAHGFAFPSERVQNEWNARKIPAPSNASANELVLYGLVDPHDSGDSVSAKQVRAFLAGLPEGTDEITVRINSPGGDAFEGIAILSALTEWQKAKEDTRKITVRVDALAASIASVIAMAGNEIIMNENAMMMIHNAWTIVAGDVNTLRKMADTLEEVDTIIRTALAKHSKSTIEDVRAWMDAETWMTAGECVERGFADRVEKIQPRRESQPEPENKLSETELAKARLRNALLRHERLTQRAA